MNRIFLVAPLCFLVVSSASAEPLTATVAVDCNEGQSISKALTRRAVELTIEISGICQEEVKITRTHVTLRGTTGPATDGIRAVAGGFDRTALDVVGVNTINIEKLSLTGGPTAGLGINASFGVNVVDCVIEDNLFAGVIVGSASGSIDLVDTVITSSAGDPRIGLWLANGSSVDCFGCTIENHRTAIQLTQGSMMRLVDSTAQGTRRGVDASGGSLFVSDVSFATIPSTIEGGSQAAIILTGNASALIADDNIIGTIRLEGKSVATLAGSIQTNTSLMNFVESGSSLVARDSAMLVGDFNITEFSNVTLPSGSTVSGSLFCSLGADAFCDTPLTATSGSDCGQCPNP